MPSEQAGKHLEYCVGEYLKRKYPESKGWHINPQFALEDKRFDCVLVKGNLTKAALTKNCDFDKVMVYEAKDVQRLTRDHVIQVADYAKRLEKQRTSLFVDDVVLVVAERTKISDDVLDYADSRDIIVKVLHEGWLSDDLQDPKTEE